MKADFFVPGTPKAQGSLTAFALPSIKGIIGKMASHGHVNVDAIYKMINKCIVMPQNPKVLEWRRTIQAHAASAIRTKLPKGVPVWVGIQIQLKRPKAHYGTGKNAEVLRSDAPEFPTGQNTGDIDKHMRSVMDALTHIAYDDDSQVVGFLPGGKMYANVEGVVVSVTSEKPE